MHMTHMEQCTEKVLQDGICLELCDHHISTPPHSHCFFEFVYVLEGRKYDRVPNRRERWI